MTANGSPVREEQTVVFDEPPPPPPPPLTPLPPEGPPSPERELWPWLLALLVLVLVGLGAGYLVTRKGHGNGHRAARPAPTAAPTTGATTPTAPAATSTTSAPPAIPAPTGASTTPPSAPSRVAVANVLGIPSADAVSRLRQDGFRTRVEPVFSTKPRRVVVAQAPAPGATAAKNAQVVLKVSKGPHIVAVPAVTGQDEQQAVAALKAAGLTPALVDVSSVKPVGTVVAQSPQAGAKIPAGRAVRLNVARTAPKTQQPPAAQPQPAPLPQPVAVPAVAGQDQHQAIAALQAAGLRAQVVGVPSAKPRGTVVAQWPRPGAQLPQGRAVRLNVAMTAPTGQRQQPPPPPVAVPDVTGVALSAARDKLRGAGLVTEIKYVPSQEAANTVVSQSPKGGANAKHGDHVLVNVSLGPKPARQAAVPNVVGQDEQSATGALQQAGFTVSTADVAVTSSSEDGIVQDEQPAGGANAPAGSEVTIYVGRFSAGSG